MPLLSTDAICNPLEMKTAFNTDWVWPSNVFKQLQLETDHNLMVESVDDVNTH
jgi:hypothetical protein